VKLSFSPEDLTAFISGLLPAIMLLFCTGLAIEAGIDISYALIHGILATRRALV